ncbi:MAG: hypothetical protein II992_13395 [Lachnospiraceae bacterium]|nr:hypothetical protein [Lachnospiraceae bacterium]
MDSLYAEVVVKPKQPIVTKIIVWIVTVFLLAFMGLAIKTAIVSHTFYVITYCLPMIIPIGALTYYFYKMSKIEYEYIYCDDTIEVARIRAKQKRKIIFRIETDNIEAFGPIDDKQMEQYSQLPERNFTSAKSINKAYAIISVIKGTKTQVLIEPSEKMIECFKIKLGKKVLQS